MGCRFLTKTNFLNYHFKVLFVSLLFFSSFFFSSFSWAQEFIEDYTNARSLGMGGVKIGITSDETSLYRNPANLGSIRGSFGSAFDPEIEGDANFFSNITIDKATQITDLKTVANLLNNQPNKRYHGRLQLSPSYTVRNIGFGIIYRNELNALASGTGTTMDTKYYNDFGAVVGANQSFFGGVLKIGGSLKAYNRIEVVSSTLSTSSTTYELKDVGAEGSAISYTGALQLQAPVKFIPTLSVVVNDIGDTYFNRKDGVRARTASQPTMIKQSVDAAVSLFPIHSANFRSVFSLEYRDITNSRNDDETAKRIHFGTELNFRDVLFVRLGYNQKYFTAGLEMSSQFFSWQISSYGEEVGTLNAPKEDRRYVTRFVVRY